MNSFTKILICLLPILLFSDCSGSGTGSLDPVEKSFVVMGDLQIGSAQTPQVNPSTTNIPQLKQNVADIAALLHKPDYSFILGDLVKAEVMNDKGLALEKQLAAWMTVFQGLPGSAGINVMPLPGNHEMDYADGTKMDEAPNPYSYPVWNAWISTNHLFPFAANGPKPEGANPDKLVQDESRYTFSFNWGAVHIVAINTDTQSTETNPATGLVYNGWIPINWIAADLAAAQANTAISTILLMGHRPIEAPHFVPPPLYGHTILDLNEYQLASDLAALLQRTPKVKAYFCSHVHSVSASRLKAAPRVWQIVSGNGGAELETYWTPPGGRFFGFSELRLHRSGRLTVANYGRAVPPPPQKFYEGTPTAPAPATLREVVELD
jgi:Calcineurin-like phosphoesterase